MSCLRRGSPQTDLLSSYDDDDDDDIMKIIKKKIIFGNDNVFSIYENTL